MSSYPGRKTRIPPASSAVSLKFPKENNEILNKNKPEKIENTQHGIIG